jgi:hypothetical protein
MQGFRGLRLLAAAAGLVVALGATQAGAVTVMANGGSYDLLSDTAFKFEHTIDGDHGVTDFGFNFFVGAANAPQPGAVVNFTLTGLNGTATNPSMVWADSDLPYVSPGYAGGTIFETAVFTLFPGGITAVLGTLFDVGKLSQWLNFGYEAFEGDSIQISLQVSAVPVPPALLLFGSGLIGMGLLARRRRNRRELTAV